MVNMPHYHYYWRACYRAVFCRLLLVFCHKYYLKSQSSNQNTENYLLVIYSRFRFGIWLLRFADRFFLLLGQLILRTPLLYQLRVNPVHLPTKERKKNNAVFLKIKKGQRKTLVAA